MPDDKKPNVETMQIDKNALYIIAYLGLFITGIIMFIISSQEDKRLKFHAMQAILLGIVYVIVALLVGMLLFLGGILAIVLEVLIWLYGLYIGFEAYRGHDMGIPVLVDFAKQYSNYDQATASKK